MIGPLLVLGALLLFAGHSMSEGSHVNRLAGLRGLDVWRRKLTIRFQRETLVGTGTDGLYNVQEIANTTPALTHILNGVAQGQSVFASPGGDLIYFSSDGQPPHVGDWQLYARPGNIV